MDIGSLVDSATTFVRDHTLWSLLISVAIGALIYWKPLGAIKVSLAVLTLGAIIYVLSFVVDLTSRGIDGSKRFTETPRVEVE